MSNIKPFSQLEDATKTELREFIANVETRVKEFGELIEVPIKHYFSRKVYAREIKLKADDFIVGKIHRFENLNILSEGEVAVCSQDGILRVKAPYTFVGTPGAKRVIYAITDVTWTTIHGTEQTNVDDIESEVIAHNYDEIEGA